MARKILSKLIAGVICFGLSITGVSAREYMSTATGRFEGTSDFEDFVIGLAADSSDCYVSIKNGSCSLKDMWSIDKTKGNMKVAIDETADKDGNITKALHYYVEGKSVMGDTDVGLLQTRPDNTSWDAKTLGKYFVYKMKFKSGGDGCGYFRGNAWNWAGNATVDWATGKANYGSAANMEAFALDEWVDFTFVVDRTGDKDIQYMRFNSSLGEKEFIKELSSRMTVKNSSPRWLSWIYGGSNTPENPSLYIDDIEIYSTDYNVTCPNNGLTGIEPSQTITLNIDGDIDETTLDTITVTCGGVPADISDISLEDGVCTINLNEKMQDFSDYTVDFSGVCSETGLKKPMTAATFSTTGKLEFLSNVTAAKLTGNSLSAISALEKGIVNIAFEAKNTTNVTATDVVLCAKLVKDGEVCGMNYQVGNVAYDETATLTSAFLIPDDTYTVEMCAKNSLNGTIYYTDIYTLSKDGIVTTAAPNEENFANIPETTAVDGTVKFRNIELGENGKSEEITSLKQGLIETTAKSADGMLISVLKKDGAITALSYCVRPQNGGAMHSALYVPQDGGYTLDTFVWSDILGTNAYMPKVGISSDTEGN